MKQRFSSLDVKVIALELSKALTSLRVTNIYDLSTRIFLIKFHKPDHREQLVIDSGFRCHLTNFARVTAAAPSPFVTRLRKYLKTRRVTSVSQVGTDRIIEFQFSDGLYKLYLEFYAAGNIVLADKDLNVIALLRNVSEGAEHEQLRVGLKYNLSLRQNYGGTPPLTKERVREGLQKAVDKQQGSSGVPAKKSKSKAGDALRKALAVSITEFPPMLVDHALRVVGFDPAIQPDQVLQDGSVLDKLMTVLGEAGKVVSELSQGDLAKGYILIKNSKARNAPEEVSDQTVVTAETSDEGLVYDDFHPFKPRQFEEDPSIKILEFEGFNKTVDEFFSSIEGQKLQSRLQEREEHARKKLEQAREDHAKRIGGLQQVQELNIRKAQAIEVNRERVEEARAAVNGLIAQGMDWIDIGRLIEAEQKRHNPVAELIKFPLKLEQNMVTLQLTESNFDEDDVEKNETDSESSEDEDEGYNSVIGSKTPKHPPERLDVDVDLALTAWANASQYYDQKKGAAVKEEKTLLASSKALKSTEQKIAADLKKSLKQEKEVLRPVRKQFWFEKFMYFISSDGYLVLGGKDAQQNDLLYRRYLKKGDVYVHADMHGAASVIIKNNTATPDAPIPPSTLSQAGNLSVATSSAWDSKAVMTAWWVTADQVSKTAESGEYLTTGGFVIRGHKNFLPPAQLLLGFAVMFQINDDSKFRHIKHRIQDEGMTPNHSVTTNEGISEQGLEEESRRSETDSESDEDFPDARLQSDLDSSDQEGSLVAERSNPLQESDTLVGIRGRRHFEETDADDAGDFIPADLEERAMPRTDDIPMAPDSTSQTKGSTRHLSARERRLFRKGQSPAISSANPSADEQDDSSAPKIDKAASAAENNKPMVKNAPLPRGKRGKQKKLAAKYADQDEEDRTLAMHILGSRAGKDQANAQAAEKKAREEEAMAQKQRRREQHLRAQTAGRASEEARRSALEGQPTGDTVLQDNDEEAARLEQVGLDTFTGRPLPGDELLAAVPVCAPWSALGTYKYKVKLQPGAQKKGKAVKEILSKWEADARDPKKVDQKSEDSERIWPREAELLRAWKEAEVIGIIPVGKVRVMMSGTKDGEGGKGKGKAPRGGKGSKKQR